MTNTKTNRPPEVRIGSTRATLWRNKTDNGERVSVHVRRGYRLAQEKREGKDDDGYRDSDYYSIEQLIVLREVVDRAINEFSDIAQEKAA